MAATATEVGTIRILLVDDHGLFRQSVARLLDSEPGFEMVGDCGSIEEGLEIVRSKPVDIVLLDYDLGGERGSDFLSRARQAGYQGNILVVTAGLPDASALQMLSQGVGGIFFKHNSPEMLATSIRNLMAGEAAIEEKYLKSLLQAAVQARDSRRGFTDRDRDVLRGLLEGKSNKDIAESLAISESAVKASLQQLFNKTGVRSRSQLVRVALEQYRDEL